ncbi:MSMEG_0570 family nitrogen starvation response protein [Cyanobium sp. Morenito 9A2]|uniref:MSMEG_0570 family nitrogen starvation response protein n=1 Tax=Cyanobium sp. Morenito 9A2 TaxID=2823718 RepID=UPI0020CDF23B|nr:MSMEG_0570 family nitrogen starvation response protein [Cyanobium sp. Morenito 9A2]MCP9848951.1 MSMEG_0570 family nitrogen starvation response protein [Cyanobium sp. Morenito 9A2]
MPEVELDLVWPDGRTTRLYSPSTVILNYLSPGQIVSVRELQERGSEALEQASERVRDRYGFACTRAEEEGRKLECWAAGYDSQEQVLVTATSDTNADQR